MTVTEPKCRVRLTEDAIADLYVLQKKDPQIVKNAFAKMLLLERSPDAGEPLLGSLVGFRKLIVGNRDWRIVWRKTEDESHQPILEIAEVWAIGARSDAEVYKEMNRRVEKLKESNHPQAKPLLEVLQAMGRLYKEVEAQPEPEKKPALPDWLRQAVVANLSLREEEIDQLDQEQAQKLLAEHWSNPR